MRLEEHEGIVMACLIYNLIFERVQYKNEAGV